MTKQTQNLSFKEAADIARKEGYLFKRPCHEGKALFFRPAHIVTTKDIQKYTSLPDVVKEVLQNLNSDISVEFSHYLCVLEVSTNGNINIGQGTNVSQKDTSASDWMLITTVSAFNFMKLTHD